MNDFPSVENRPFDALEVGEELRLVHTLTTEDFSLLATQAATLGAGLIDPIVAATRAFSVDAAQNGWASALMGALIAGRLPGAGSKLLRQTIETTGTAQPGDVLTVTAKVMAKAPEGRRVTVEVRAANQRGELAMAASAEIMAPKKTIVAEPREEFVEQMREKGRRYKILIERTRDLKPLRTAVVHPVDEASLLGAIEAAREDLMEPVLVGPEARIRRAAATRGLDISPYPIVPTEHSHAAADKAVAMARSGEVEALMKGALHTDELMHAVVATETGLRTARRTSHVFAIDAPAYPRPLFITDAAVNIYPTLLDKRDIVQNAIDLVVALGIVTPRVAILSAVETVSPDIRSTLDAAALCKMADRGQIVGGILDGPLAFDNAVSSEAARAKGIVSPVAGQADIFLVPDLEAGNMLAKQLVYLADAEMAGIVLGARVPIMLTSRADNTIARLGSCAIALILARHRQAGQR
jgi:phosphate acetyltransferase/phosphate butyryltransferase